jgi:regulatory protein YycI of two-component signal transduction system YycFG
MGLGAKWFSVKVSEEGISLDWSKTKTIFIITFLILDLFLGYQFMQKRSSSQLDVILEATIEEQLEADGITYVDLPKEVTKATYVSGKSKVFTEEEIKSLNNQRIETTNQLVLQAKFIKPILIQDPSAGYRLSEFLRQNIISGEKYTFWKYDEDTKTLIYFQQYDGKVIYKNVSSMLLIHLNDKNEMISYEQTMLEDLEKDGEKQEILPAIKALETLYKKNLLKPGDRVTKIDLGYYALVQFTASQVLTPTWHVVVNGKTDYYVNAFEGRIISDENKVLE